MGDTKRGRLGAASLSAGVNTSVYAVTDGRDAVVDILISNFAGQKEFAEIDIAIVDGAVGDIAAEDYIYNNLKLDYGKVLVLPGQQMSADECVVANSSVSGVVVRVSGVEQEAASGSSPALQICKLTSQVLDFDDFTDDSDFGYIYFDEDLPAGALVLGWRAKIIDGFIGDVSATFQVGVEDDPDAFSATTTQSCFIGENVYRGCGAQAAEAGVNAHSAQPPRVTVTTDADFSDVTAGSMIVDLYYIQG